ncbi:hypothetical protein LT85_3139 [Collimonas arenae]|uniref:Uncharacterized protein n=1 Tax=Collimonas arenae TaxID=279058 RepID=A0A0A1FHG0_9BURK|nr:hypothetical protein LT85_3139 [Collimonas arenae]
MHWITGGDNAQRGQYQHHGERVKQEGLKFHNGPKSRLKKLH